MRSPIAAHRRKLILATTVTLALGTSAQAGDLVSSCADTSTGFSRGCAATYNDGGGSLTGAHFVSDAGNLAPCPSLPCVADGSSTIIYSGSTETAGARRRR